MWDDEIKKWFGSEVHTLYSIKWQLYLFKFVIILGWSFLTLHNLKEILLGVYYGLIFLQLKCMPEQNTYFLMTIRAL